MPNDCPAILIADDEEAFRTAFIRKHSGSGITVEQLTDVLSLPEHLSKRKTLPDLVVMDLYRTKADPGTAGADHGNNVVDDLLAKLETVTAELKTVVDQVKTPAAIKVLREIRSSPRLKNLPVLIYTRQGLSILSDDDLRDAIHLNAEWMLKGRSAAVEREQMTSFLRTAQLKKRRLERDVALTLLGGIFGLVIGEIWKILTS